MDGLILSNGKSGRPNRISLSADMMRISDPDSPVQLFKLARSGKIMVTDVHTRL